MSFRSPVGRCALVAGALAAAALSACDPPPVNWSDPTQLSADSAASRLTVDAAGRGAYVRDSTAAEALPAAVGLCPATVRLTAGTRSLHAAWWNVRPDSSALLYVANSSDAGRTWDKPVAVDTTDVSPNGCTRPAPSLAAVGDDVYVAYSMVAPEGKGVFFAHFMGSMLHSPVPVIYGDRLVATAITADANHVAVAYEQPNGRREQVDVALSVSQGHIFEKHFQASRDVDIATAPAVALNGPTIAVSWLTHPLMDSTLTRVVRVGRLQQ